MEYQPDPVLSQASDAFRDVTFLRSGGRGPGYDSASPDFAEMKPIGFVRQEIADRKPRRSDIDNPSGPQLQGLLSWLQLPLPNNAED